MPSDDKLEQCECDAPAQSAEVPGGAGRGGAELGVAELKAHADINTESVLSSCSKHSVQILKEIQSGNRGLGTKISQGHADLIRLVSAVRNVFSEKSQVAQAKLEGQQVETKRQTRETLAALQQGHEAILDALVQTNKYLLSQPCLTNTSQFIALIPERRTGGDMLDILKVGEADIPCT